MNTSSPIINHSMIALILRFVGHHQRVSYCNQEFIKKQLKTIQEHIQQFPPEQQEYRAVAWIEKYAKRYREEWEKELVFKEFSHQRCEDCPIGEPENFQHCKIHDQWLKLLQQYMDGELDSSRYVTQSLKLLSDYKNNLKLKIAI